MAKQIKLNLFGACTDGQDGTFSMTLCNTRKAALKILEKTEEELEDGCFYDDGAIAEVELILIEKDGKLQLKSQSLISIGE